MITSFINQKSTTNLVFRTTRGWSFFIYLFTPPLIALFVFLGLLPFLTEEFQWTFFLVFLPLSIGMISFLILGLIDTVKGKFIIEPDRVRKIGIFKNKELKKSEIKGYRINQYFIHLIPSTNNLPKISISRYYNNKSALNQWLFDNYPDLDIVESRNDEKEIFLSSKYGNTVEQREKKLKSARVVSRILNILGTMVGFWLFIYPYPYKLVTLIALSFPLLVIIALFKYRGLIRIDQNNNSGYPSSIMALVMPSMGLFLRGFLDFNILEYSNIWFLSSLLTCVIVIEALTASQELKFKKANDFLILFIITVFLFGFSYGAILNINCSYDKSRHVSYHTEILDMNISSGRSTSYYLKLAPWGPKEVADKVGVSQSLYEKLKIGETVNIYLKEGKLKIPWFYITEKQE